MSNVGAQINWYIPQRVVYIRWDATVTLDTIEQVSAAVRTLMDEATAPCHILNDARDVASYPVNVMEIRGVMTFIDHPKLEWLISITSNPVVTFLADIVPQMITKTRSKATMDVDIALDFLRCADCSLDWSQALMLGAYNMVESRPA